MAGKTNLSATLFSQKKLLGKTSTGTHRADSNEPIPSGLQVASQAVFAEDIPTSPSRTLFTVQSASAGKPGTVEYVEFLLQSITGSTYDANDFDGDASAQVSGPHAYRLVLSESYQDNTDNSKSGTYPFVNNQILHWTIGGLQLVSPGFSNDVPNPYTLKLFEEDGSEIPLLDEIDWQVDYFSGILFVQDYDSSKIPHNAKAFIYTGKMLSQSLGEALAGGGGGSGNDVGWFGSGNGSISTSGSVYFGTQNTSNPEIFFSSVGAATFNEQGRNSDFRIEAVNKPNAFKVDADTQQILILSGGAANSVDEASGADVAFYVSGTVDSKNSSNRGLSLFGGDLVSSGSVTAEFGISGSLTQLSDGSSYLIAGDNVTIFSASNGSITISSTAGGEGTVDFNGGPGEDNQMITADGSGNIVAESNITFNGSQLSVTGTILPGSDNTYDLGSPSFRFANIYTGDLHLQNERGHWQVIEEADALTVINRLTDVRYKILMEPYEED